MKIIKDNNGRNTPSYPWSLTAFDAGSDARRLAAIVLREVVKVVAVVMGLGLQADSGQEANVGGLHTD